MLVLVLKILGPLLFFVSSEWSKLWDPGERQRHQVRIGFHLAAAFVAVAVLVVDDRAQAAAVAEARAEAAADRQSRQNLSESVDVIVALMRERDPDLARDEALDRVAREMRELRGRSANLEDQLDGLRVYGDVARLNVFGDPGIAGAGLSYSSALTRALQDRGTKPTASPICAAIKQASPISGP